MHVRSLLVTLLPGVLLLRIRFIVIIRSHLIERVWARGELVSRRRRKGGEGGGVVFPGLSCIAAIICVLVGHVAWFPWGSRD